MLTTQLTSPGTRLVLGAATAVSVIAGTIAFAGGASAGPAPDLDAARSKALSAYVAFDRPANSGDSIVVDARRQASIATDLRVVAGSHRVLRTRDHGFVSIAESETGEVCLIIVSDEGEAVTNCVDPTERPPVLMTFGHAVGAAPSGAAAVSVRLTDGSDVSVPVVNGLFSTPSNATSVTVNVNGSPKVIELLPASTKPAGLAPGSAGLLSLVD